MKYLEIDFDGRVNYIHDRPLDEIYGLGKPESELLKSGILVDHIPMFDMPVIDGKEPVLFYVDGVLKYEQVDSPKSPMDAQIQQLKEQQAATDAMVLQLLMEGVK